ncbi:ADC synthase [Violaceomyces palustris]|uniref:ADC synthase n=1 Tax=Violaceomyces palustris TaxID=1673888 RepID=A0ACD0NXC2_9BASI|nr:ADC synthase [Violaceomyces palustris]
MSLHEGKGDTASFLPRILIIDHHDSYTLNLLSLLLPSEDQAERRKEMSALLPSRVVVLPHNHGYLKPQAFQKLIKPHIDAIILSPGPGTPENPNDFGAAEALLKDENLGIPILGVCLGHQGLATAFGGKVKRARSVRHGLRSPLRWSPDEEAVGKKAKTEAPGGILAGIPENAQVVRYNSLTVDEETLPQCLRVTSWAFDDPCRAPPPRLFASALESRLRSEQHSLVASATSSAYASSCPDSPSACASPLVSASTSSSADGHCDMTEIDPGFPENPNRSNLERVILSMQHNHLPIHSVQFHPESIESNYGRQIMSNFLKVVEDFWKGQGTDVARRKLREWHEYRAELPQWLRKQGDRCVSSGSSLELDSLPDQESKASIQPFKVKSRRFRNAAGPGVAATLAPKIFERLFRQSKERSSGQVGSVWLDSARPRDPHSRYSFMASPSFSLSYDCFKKQLVLHRPALDGSTENEPVDMKGAIRDNDEKAPSFWGWMNQLQCELKTSTDFSEAIVDLDEHEGRAEDMKRTYGSVFRTGFVGYWGYEMKEESLDLERPEDQGPISSQSGLPDAEFAFCNKVLAFDHVKEEWIAFALIQDQDSAEVNHLPTMANLHRLLSDRSAMAVTPKVASDWFDQVGTVLDSELHQLSPTTSSRTSLAKDVLPLLKPDLDSASYKARIEQCREIIASGESYELCLTTQFRGKLTPNQHASSYESGKEDLKDDHFELYLRLRERNPAPYSAFLHLPDLDCGSVADQRWGSRSILSTSPERFMRITMQGQVEMKPIKGTLARAGWGVGEAGMRAGDSGEEEEREKREWREREDKRRREKLSADIKERAENLMIVDLIRADLYSFCQIHSVKVPALMKVESYETVHQLVTTVSGQLKEGVGSCEAVMRCFPPGSMTGAPKLRSVQLLEGLETQLCPEIPALLSNPRSTTFSPSPCSNEPLEIACRGVDASRQAKSGHNSSKARRGIYSGSLGWMGIDGSADFSVVIRTAFVNGDEVSLGAGGAITYLSDPEQEWREVLDKIQALANVEA